MNKDLLFVLNNGDEYIKAKFIEDDNQLYFLSADETVLFDNLEEFKNSNLNIFKENEVEMSLLIESIEEDLQLTNKILTNQGDKLMFRYDNEKFNKYLLEQQ